MFLKNSSYVLEYKHNIIVIWFNKFKYVTTPRLNKTYNKTLNNNFTNV